MVFTGGLALLAVAVLWAIFPRVVGIPVAVVLGWLGLSLLWKAWRLRKPGATMVPASLPTTLDGATGVPPPGSKRSGELRTDVPS